MPETGKTSSANAADVAQSEDRNVNILRFQVGLSPRRNMPIFWACTNETLVGVNTFRATRIPILCYFDISQTELQRIPRNTTTQLCYTSNFEIFELNSFVGGV